MRRGKRCSRFQSRDSPAALGEAMLEQIYPEGLQAVAGPILEQGNSVRRRKEGQTQSVTDCNPACPIPVQGKGGGGSWYEGVGSGTGSQGGDVFSLSKTI